MSAVKVPQPHPQRPLAAMSNAVAKLAASHNAVVGETGTDIDVTLTAEHLHPFVSELKRQSALSFDYLRNIAGVDFEAEGMALKYQLYSFKHGHSLQITVPTTNGHPHVPTITDLYPAADWHEREASEMFGFVFDGHPNPKNLLLEEDLHIHPLLKAHPLQKVEILQGIEDGPPGFKF
ncbi:MAG: NADH-quinone oxidoreductase subunit C [Dehalococcoidia bacterium]